jgi:DNA-binding response OmpR family regulator
MKILIAEDNGLFRKVLQQVLGHDYELVVANDGNQAWEALQFPDAPRFAILDWVMPGLTGPQICRKVRACAALSSMYLIILTAKNSESDIVAGLRSGADDYLTKPPIPAELRARVRVGERILALQDEIAAQSDQPSRLAWRGNQPRELVSHGLVEHQLTRRTLRGIEACTDQSCETGDSCSISCAESDSLMHRLLAVSLESSHPRR